MLPFFQAILRGARFDRHKNIHSKGNLLTPAQRRKCLTKLFEVFLYSSPGILLNYRLDKAPRLFFVLHFCRNPSKQNAIMEECSSRQHSDSRNLLAEAGIQLISKIWNTNWNCRHSPAGQHSHWKNTRDRQTSLAKASKFKCPNYGKHFGMFSFRLRLPNDFYALKHSHFNHI